MRGALCSADLKLARDFPVRRSQHALYPGIEAFLELNLETTGIADDGNALGSYDIPREASLS
jgi:hypothetical protein